MIEKRWSFSGGVIVGTDICEKGIPHTNRSIVTHLNRYERKIKELEEENKQLKKLISKIDLALITKYDNSFENILDEVYSGEYDKWIQKQVKRSFDLE